jgi:hypothetical protein
LPTYHAFWTDTARRFQAINLFDVHPGDEIIARLALSSQAWHVSILDAPSGLRATFATHDETGVEFDSADWFQEHVTDQQADETIPYPRTGPIAIRKLEVNAAPPNPVLMRSQWMTANGRYLAPTRLKGDAFLVQETTLGPAAERYLRILVGLSRTTQSFFAQISSPTTRRPQIESERTQLLRASERALGRLRGAPWPAAVQNLIATLEQQNQALIVQTRTLPASGDLRTWAYNWWNKAEAVSGTNQAIRRALGLPPTGAD